MVEPICVAAYCAVQAPVSQVFVLMRHAQVVVCEAACRCWGAHTLPVILKILYDLIHNLDVRVSLALRLSDLLRVAAALGDEVVAILPRHVSMAPVDVFPFSRLAW